jgi:hypothetical protein
MIGWSKLGRIPEKRARGQARRFEVADGPVE